MEQLRNCRRCRFVKSEADFYESSPTICKICVRKKVGEHRAANIERIRAYDRSRGFRGKPTHVADYKAKFPQRRAAQMAVSNATRSGKLSPLPCFICGDEAEAHHPDYSKPLEVVWLCPPHHKQAHALARKAA